MTHPSFQTAGALIWGAASSSRARQGSVHSPAGASKWSAQVLSQLRYENFMRIYRLRVRNEISELNCIERHWVVHAVLALALWLPI